MNLSLRQADADDLDAIMALETAGFEPGIVEDTAVFAHRLAAFPQGFLLADVDGTSCGYFCSEIWRDWSPEDHGRFDLGHDVSHWLDTSGQAIYIASMTISPEFRGGGLGHALLRGGLREMAQRFPALTEAVLIVNEHWQAARRIYEQAGFVETGRLSAFFDPASGPVGDAILMTAAINSASRA